MQPFIIQVGPSQMRNHAINKRRSSLLTHDGKSTTDENRKTFKISKENIHAMRRMPSL